MHNDFDSKTERSIEESDSMKKKENSVIDLFNENDIEEPSLECTNPDTEERSSEYQYCSSIFLNEETSSGWFDEVCDRHSCRTSSIIQPHIASSSSSSSSSSFSSSSSSSIPPSGSSLSSLDGVFNPTPLSFYNRPDEILDWSDWLASVCVSDADRKHIDLCVSGLIPIPHKTDAVLIRNGVLRGIQMREREREKERERERNTMENILREKRKESNLKKSSKSVEIDDDNDNNDNDDDDNDNDDNDNNDDDNDEDEDDNEEEEEEDESYAGKRNRISDSLPSRYSSRKRKADLNEDIL